MASPEPGHAAAQATPVHGPHVWYRHSFRDTRDFYLDLSPEILAEIDRSVQALRTSGRKWDEISIEDMPLHSFAPVARRVTDEVMGQPGRGFTVVRGLDLARYSKEEVKAVYWAIGQHFGSLIPQNLKGDRMVTVADRGYDPADKNIRNSMTNRAIGFHTDTVILGEIDIIGLLCIVQAEQGGDSRLASAAAVYNTIAAEAPELLEPLSHDFPIDRRAEYTREMGPTANAPLLKREGELVRSQCHYNLMLTGAQKINRVFTAAENAGVDKMNEVLGRDDIAFEFRLLPGEMLFASNSLVLHDRSRWVDIADPEKKRHLERMWLAAR